MKCCLAARGYLRKSALGSLVVSALLLPLAHAQSIVDQALQGTITPGIPTLGVLDGGSFPLPDTSPFETWSFTVTETSSISIDFVSTDFDTFGSISLSDDTLLVSNDDCPIGPATTNSCIQDFIVVPGTTYYVGVGTAPGESGNYALMMSATVVPEPSTSFLAAIAGLMLLRRRRR